MSEQKHITIKGARVHNLKNITVEIPKNRLVVITGKSGSGKSSLAFDTLYAEGQRRYVESLSAYARQFLEQMQKPDVDAIEGLSPAIAIEQKTVSKSPRSTVATITEIYDYLRVLFARAGTPYCYSCGREIVSQTVQEMVDRIMALPAGEKIIVLSPVVRGKKGEFKKELSGMIKNGFVRARIDGRMQELSSDLTLDKNKKHTIDIAVDRLVIKPGIEKRLADSLQTALQFSDGIVQIAPFSAEEMVFSEHHACIECGISYAEISPRTFSFNSPYGACPACSGLGHTFVPDITRIIPDPSRTLREGALAPLANSTGTYFSYFVDSLARHYGFSLDTAFNALPSGIQNVLLYGSGNEKIPFTYEDEKRAYSTKKAFEGIIPYLNRRYHETESDQVRDDIRRYMTGQPCAECGGARLKKESLFVKISGCSIADITAMPVTRARDFISGLTFSPQQEAIAAPLIKEIRHRLYFLAYLGLGYLTLDRVGGTLSGGEAHRIRLATQLGTRLSGVLYVLDEPSVGLHPRDTERLLNTLCELRDIGNTIIVVEHDAATIRAADYVVDLGPGAGTEGGSVVAAGTPQQIEKNARSVTGRYLSGKKHIPLPVRRKAHACPLLSLRGAAEHNLKNISIDIPLGLFVCITGVSGSGKSTLLLDTLYPALSNKISRTSMAAGAHTSIGGHESIQNIIHIDQSPIGRTPRSNPATFTGLFNLIRDIFAKLPESKIRGYRPGRFSFNVKGGRCEACQGDGLIKIEMHFLPDMYVVCDVCGGRRYNRETLEITYKGKNIAQVLDMTVQNAMQFFENIPSIRNKLQVLNDVGLGYLTLGQQATTLSGGEAQRIKLSRELGKKTRGHTLYILDEPTTGLHFDDVAQLLNVLDALVDKGNTVVVIEHNLDVIKTADYIIELGPEGGEGGGTVVACGSPEEVAASEMSPTGMFLQKVIAAP